MKISYSEFLLTEELIALVKHQHEHRAISQYIKLNGIEPSNIDQYYIATDEEIERARRVFYTRYLCDICNPLPIVDVYEYSNGHTRETAEPGDIVYYNGTPIGVVTIALSMVDDGIGRMASLPNMSRSNPKEGLYKAGIVSLADADYRMEYYGNNVEIEGLDNIGNIEDAKLDMNGKENTAAILAFQTYYTDFESIETIDRYHSSPAAVSCHVFRTVGTNMGDWYLPSAGELTKTAENVSLVNRGYRKLNEGIFNPEETVPLDTVLNAVPFGDINDGNFGGNFGQWYWSSTQRNSTHAWYYNFVNASVALSSRNKASENSWGEIKAFCHF